MTPVKVKLNAKQLDFLREMLEIDEPKAAAQKFFDIMIEEKMDPQHIGEVIDLIMKKANSK